MRLLSLSASGGYELTEFLDDVLTPPYAILSHTWLEAEHEPTFQDLQQGTAQGKKGYDKVRFCGEQARRHGITYFWVDTCCINKKNHAELSSAISSMFHWYEKAARCYVYLSDVHGSEHTAVRKSFDSELYNSKWFTRGWTLQELLAPQSVEFFSAEGTRLGNKSTLGEQICDITRIPVLALQGARLSQFSREERFTWSSSRRTSIDEDMIYSLIGIFNIEMPPNYGEGIVNARVRLENAIERREKCIQDIRQTDPRDEKRRIEGNKGGLLQDVYCWVLQNPQFQQWLRAEQCSILWVRGDPGKGKTMLLCGIIDELQKIGGSVSVLSYFFCQATDQRANNATAVLRGLMFMLISQRPSLVCHVQAEYDNAGKPLFEGVNAWVTFSRILQSMLADPVVYGACIIVDALDECSERQSELLSFIVTTSSWVKWIVSSRNWSNIEKGIDRATQAVRLSLELNERSISAAVKTYTYIKVKELADRHSYTQDEFDAVLCNLEQRSDGTFLWVALVCQELLHEAGWEARETSKEFPPGLEPLYWRMMEQISRSKRSVLCKEVLAIASLVQRPLTLAEMSSLIPRGPAFSSGDKVWMDIIQSCGSFLTVRKDIVSFVHQSAKDFLVGQAYQEIYPSGAKHVHHAIFTQSLDLISKNLHRDMYNLRDPGISITQVRRPAPHDPLAAVRYSCVYWIEHLLESRAIEDEAIIYHRGLIRNFFEKYYLFWLEASSLCESMSAAQISIAKLENTLRQKASAEMHQLLELAYDARRFIMYHKTAIESFPLQIYASALLFSPQRSLIRGLYNYEELGAVKILPPLANEWSACLQTLEGHSGDIDSVAFSPDSTRLASGSYDRMIRIWDAGSGACLQTLEGHSGFVHSVAFSPDSTRLASGSGDRTIRIWDAGSGACLQTLEGHSDSVHSVAFSPDSTRLASGSWDRTIRIWDAGSGACLQTLEGHSDSVNSVWRLKQVTFRANNIQCFQCQTETPIWDGAAWIKYKSIKLWLPLEYRGDCSDVLADAISIGTSSGKVWLCNFDRNLC